MKNSYEVRGDTTAIIITSRKFGRLEALISTNKLERAQQFEKTWYVSWSDHTKSFYVKGTLVLKNIKKTISLHRWIMDAPESFLVDHINHNTLDNTDQNLRLVNNAKNQQNRKGPTVKNTSGYLGVTWFEQTKRWRAQIRIDGKNIHLGYFDDAKEAEQAYLHYLNHHTKEKEDSKRARYYNPWTQEEDLKLLGIMESLGNRTMSELLSEASTTLRRTVKSCENRWYKLSKETKAM